MEYTPNRGLAAVPNAATTVQGRARIALASVVGEERARDGLKRRAHDSSRAMDGEARLSLARTIRVRPPCYCLEPGGRSYEDAG
jgi:hypothetical protein